MQGNPKHPVKYKYKEYVLNTYIEHVSPLVLQQGNPKHPMEYNYKEYILNTYIEQSLTFIN